MADEIYTYLESSLYGGLLQVLETVAFKIEADCAAGRVFGIEDAAVDACSINGRLGLKPAQESALRNWPGHDGCLFELVHKLKPPTGVCRPRDYISEAEYADGRLFRQIESTHHVSDCLCQVLDLGGNAWVVLCYIRCAPSLPYTEEQITALHRLQPDAQRVIQAALRREMQSHAPESSDVTAHAPISRLIAKLSETERQILSYLRLSLTEKEIAKEVGRSHHTVHVHVKNIYRKFGATSRKQVMERFMSV